MADRISPSSASSSASTTQVDEQHRSNGQQQQKEEDVAVDPSRTLSDLRAELSTLNRVSHRLAMTDAGPKFARVLDVLLPRLLQRVGKNDDARKGNNLVIGKNNVRAGKRKSPSSPSSSSSSPPPSSLSSATLPPAKNATAATSAVYGEISVAHDAIHDKLIEMLGHAMKRVREDRECRLPCLAISESLLLPIDETGGHDGEHDDVISSSSSSFANPFAINLGLAFLTLGVNRCSPTECAALIPSLLSFLGRNFDRRSCDPSARSSSSDETTTTASAAAAAVVGVGHLLDPGRRTRVDRTWHLVLRCLESVASRDPAERAASGRAGGDKNGTSSSNSSNSKNNNSNNNNNNNNGASPAESPAVIAPTLRETKRSLSSDPVLAGATFDLFVDVLSYSPVPANSAVVPGGMSPAGYERLVGGAASEEKEGGRTNNNRDWKEEHATRGERRATKLRLLELIAPCRRHALFLHEKPESEEEEGGGSRGDGGGGEDDAKERDADNDEGGGGSRASPASSSSSDAHGAAAALGASRTVALMVLLSGDTDPDVATKAESYLRAYMDTHRGREGGGGANTAEMMRNALLGDPIALARTLLSWAAGGAAAANVASGLRSRYYRTVGARATLENELGLTHRLFAGDDGVDADGADDASRRKAVLSCRRSKAPRVALPSLLKFVARMLDDDPRMLFRASAAATMGFGDDAGKKEELEDSDDESDVAAVSVGTLILAVLGDLRRPGSSASPAMGAAAALLNSLCVRLSLFYDARVGARREEGAVSPSERRIGSLLARSMAQACAVLAPASSGEATSVSSSSSAIDGTRASKVPIEVRDRCYGVVCTLARSRFSLDGGRALFDRGEQYVETASSSSSSSRPPSISTATLLFGCASNETEALRPRAAEACDALLGAYVRVVESLLAAKKERDERRSSSSSSSSSSKRKEEANDANVVVDPLVAANPWATDVNVAEKREGPSSTGTDSNCNDNADADNDDDDHNATTTTDGLARSLLPLLWSASRPHRSKSSRLAAADWTGELLLRLDDVDARHLLCFLSGDADATVSTVARRRLGVEASLGEDHDFAGPGPGPTTTISDPRRATIPNSTEETADDAVVVAAGGRATFGALMDAIVGTSAPSSGGRTRRPRFAEFHVRGQAATLRFLLHSLFGDESFYDDGEALREYVSTILTTLAYHDRGRSQPSREETDLLDECSIALASCTSTSRDARLVVVKRGGDDASSSSSGPRYGYEDIAAKALTSNSSKTRRHLAEVICHLYEDRDLWKRDDDDDAAPRPSVPAWVERTGLARTAQTCGERLRTMFEASHAVGEVHGAAFLGSSCVRAFRLAVAEEGGESNDGNDDDEEEETDQSSNKVVVSDCWERCRDIVSSLGRGLAHSDIAVGNACSRGIVTAFSYNGRDAPALGPELFDAMAIVTEQMRLALKKFSSIDHADPARASSLIRAAGLLLAASTSGAGFARVGDGSSTVVGGGGNGDSDSAVDLGPARLGCVEALFGILGSAAYRKDDELSLVVGEALVRYADALGGGEWSGAGIGPDSGPDSEEWKEGPYEESFAFDLPPHRHVLYTMFQREAASSNPLKRNSCAAALLALIGHASRMANVDPSSVRRAFVREVWKRLGSFQAAFLRLLADPKSKHLSRESCCKGLAACRGLAAVMTSSNEAVVDEGESRGGSRVESLNEQLLKAFGQTTNYGRSAMMESETQAEDRRRNEGEGGDVEASGRETQVGGAAGMSEATLGAYREMASAAISLGKIDVLYSLLVLSTNHPLWRLSQMKDRYSARALLGKAEGASVEEIRVSLRPHMGQLVPKLLRACNDPSKQTRDNMNNLWLALTGGGAESRAIVNRHLLPTIDVLIQDAGSKLWRARAGACGALADIIVGKSWQELGGGGVELDDEGIGMKPTASIRLLRLWKITMRALDDVRTAVRERGETLGRGVRALTIRLCDPTMTELAQESNVYLSNAQRKQLENEREISAEYAATVSLGWLVKYGLNQPCAEASGICVSCLLGIVDVAKPSTLQPVLAELVGSLLMAMSGLEPAALNYLQVRAAGNDANSQAASGPDRYDQLERLRINLALSGPIAGALHKCLEMVQFVELDAQKKLIPELDSSLRKGAGFATRAATADAVGTLCSKCPAAFAFSGSSMSNPTVRLLRALYFASERERGVTAKDKMTHALGSLAELAPGNAVRILALKACERYCESSGSNNDPSIRKAAAATIRAVAVRASSHLSDGGPKDIWCKKVLPTAFLGRHDKDAKISSLWKDVWEEGGSAISSMDRDDVFGVLLQEKLLPFIVKATVLALQSTSWANRRAGCAVLIELTDAHILAPTPRSISDGSSFSAAEINRLRQRAKASTVLLSECLKIISRNRVWEGKGDVVKAATSIAGKWSASAPMNGKGTELSDKCNWPIVLEDNARDDMFKGDSWFKLSDGTLSEENDEGDFDDTNNTCIETDGPNSKDDTALDLNGDNDLGDDEQLFIGEGPESDVEEYQGSQTLVFSGFCRVLLDQALRTGSNNSTEGVLPYKSSALSGLSVLLKSIVPAKNSENHVEAVEHQHFVYDLLAPNLFSFIAENQSTNGKPVPPLLIARALECLASAMYHGVGGNAGGAEYGDAVKLLKFFAFSTGKQPAWTVRQMSALAASSLVSHMPPEVLKKNEVITTVLECSKQTLKDKKFWKVRLSGLEVLLSLANRVGNQKMSSVDPEKQLIMEAILPYKEIIIDLARKSLADSESQVTATASKITLTMAWWP